MKRFKYNISLSLSEEEWKELHDWITAQRDMLDRRAFSEEAYLWSAVNSLTREIVYFVKTLKEYNTIFVPFEEEDR